MKSIDPDSVLFNWECCSELSCGEVFHFHDKEIVVNLINYLITKGHMVMCSDFATKALITDWNEKLLGPNPFV